MSSRHTIRSRRKGWRPVAPGLRLLLVALLALQLGPLLRAPGRARAAEPAFVTASGDHLYVN